MRSRISTKKVEKQREEGRGERGGGEEKGEVQGAGEDEEHE